MSNEINTIQNFVKLSYSDFIVKNKGFSKEKINEIGEKLISPSQEILFSQDMAKKHLQEFLVPELLKNNKFNCGIYADDTGRKFEYFYKHIYKAPCVEQKHELYIKIATSNSATRIKDILKILLKDLSLLQGFQTTLVLCVNNSLDNTFSNVLDCVSWIPFDVILFYIHPDQFYGFHKRQSIATANNLIYQHISTKCTNQPKFWVGMDDDIQLGENSYSKIGLLIENLQNLVLAGGPLSVNPQDPKNSNTTYLLSVHKFPEIIQESPCRPFAYGAFYAMQFKDYIPVPTDIPIPNDVFYSLAIAGKHINEMTKKNYHNGKWPVSTIAKASFIHIGKVSLYEWIQSKQGILLSRLDMKEYLGNYYRHLSSSQNFYFMKYWIAIRYIIKNRFGFDSIEFASHIYLYYYLLPKLIEFWRDKYGFFDSPYPALVND